MSALDKGSTSSSVKVVARFRPPNSSEMGYDTIAFIDRDGKTVTLDGQRKAAFTFDRVFGPEATQDEVYEFAAKSIVEDVLKGYNGTIFAYGQTSSGKTYTMEGPNRYGPNRGIIPRIVEDIFNFIDIAPEFYEFTVRVSYFEIYMERIRDLLCDGNTNLQIHESKEKGVYVRHATELFMQDAESVMQVFHSGAERRAVASTNMNDYSSRSHSVFMMEIGQKDTIHGGSKTGKLYLVDLAGSEKVSKTGADGEVLEEAKNINKSLSALGLVIMNLTDPQAHGGHVPYRDSKLTRILQESLGGNARTTIVINSSPSVLNEAESFSSMRFGQRAKKIKNNAVINIQYSAEELKVQLDAAKREIRKLAQKLASAEQELQIWRSGGAVSEEMRVALTTTEETPIATAEAEAAQRTTSAQNTGLSEQEKEEWLRRETELLESLDDKDAQIRSLERDIEALEKEKLGFTTLAVENAGNLEKIRIYEERVEELAQENSAYELAIEDMDHRNRDLEEELARLKEQVTKVQADLDAEKNRFSHSTNSIAEALTHLCQPIKGEIPVNHEYRTPIDPHLSKMRKFVVQLQVELSGFKDQAKELETTKQTLEKSLQELEKSLRATKQNLQLTEEKLNAGLARNSELMATINDLERQKSDLQNQVNDILGKIEDIENKYAQVKMQANMEMEHGEARVHEMKQALEKQKDVQRQEHIKQVADLRTELTVVNEERSRLNAEKDALQITLEDIKVDLQSQRERFKQQSEKLEELRAAQEREAEVARQTQGLTEATQSQLKIVDEYRDKVIANLRKKKERFSGGADNGEALNPQHSQHVSYLEKVNRELTVAHQEAVKAHASAQRDLAVLEKQLQARNERIKNLEALMKQGEEEMQRQYDLHMQDMQILRNQGGPQVRTVQRRKSGVAPINNKPEVISGPIRGGGGRQQPRVNPVGIVGQGAPLIGQFAMNKDPSDVAFV